MKHRAAEKNREIIPSQKGKRGKTFCTENVKGKEIANCPGKGRKSTSSIFFRDRRKKKKGGGRCRLFKLVQRGGEIKNQGKDVMYVGKEKKKRKRFYVLSEGGKIGIKKKHPSEGKKPTGRVGRTSGRRGGGSVSPTHNSEKEKKKKTR